MWLTLQVAAGIVLAYVIIRNGAAVWRFSIGALIVVGIAIGVFALASIANEATADYGGIGAVILDILKFVGGFLALIGFPLVVYATGCAISYIIFNLTKGKWPQDKWTLFLGFFNFGLTGLTLQGFTLTSSGPIFEATNAYGRAHGLEDGLTVALWLIVSTWPLVVAYVLKRNSDNVDPSITEDG